MSDGPAGSKAGTDRTERWRAGIIRFVQSVNPLGGNPSSTVEAVAALDSFGPSLMPRSSVHQGVVTGLAVLAARFVGRVNEQIVDTVVPAERSLSRRLGVRGALAAAGSTLAALPHEPHESTARASVRAGGRLLLAGAVGGAVFDLGESLRRRYPSQRAIRPLVVTAAASAGLAIWLQRRLSTRQQAIEPSPVPSKNSMAASVGAAFAVTAVGTGLGRAFLRTRRGLERLLGP
jgi:hypothetical protein